MSDVWPQVWLARHGETAWSLTGQHTGRADIPLTERGELDAKALGERLRGETFAAVFTSPLKRATRTAELAGFGGVAIADPDLMEWNYGAYEGRTLAQIRVERPGWDLFRDGCPGGESLADLGARADRVIERLRALKGDALLFAHGHLLRFVGARWLGLEPDRARSFHLATASLSILGYEHTLERAVIRLWNDDHHIGG
jgi:broad specificity phosphatase PhoE